MLFGLLWLVAIVLIVLWAIGFFIMHIGALIHAVLLIALVVIVGNLLRGVGSRGATV
jgi:hypothetical protein